MEKTIDSKNLNFNIEELYTLWGEDNGTKMLTEEQIRFSYSEKMKTDSKNMMQLAKQCEKDIKELEMKKPRGITVTKDYKSVEYMRTHVFKIDTYLCIFRDGELRKYEKTLPQVFKMIPKELMEFYLKDISCPEFTLISEINERLINLQKRTINSFPELRFEGSSEDKYIEDKQSRKVLKFLKERICGDSEGLFGWLCNYISYLTVNRRTNVILYLFGAEGQGKSVFIDFICSMLGKKRCQDARLSDIAGTFSGFLMNKQVIRIEETAPVTGKNPITSEASSRMRNIATGDTEPIRKMYTDLTDGRIFCNLQLCSNHLPPVEDAKGRRFTIIHVKTLKKTVEELEEYWTKINKILKNEKVIKNMFLYFRDREIIYEDLQKAGTKFESDIKYDLVTSKSPLHLWLQNKVRLNNLDAKYWQVDLYDEYIRDIKQKSDFHVSPQNFGVFLSNLPEGCVTKTRRNAGSYLIFDLSQMQKSFGKTDEEIEHEREKREMQNDINSSVFDEDKSETKDLLSTIAELKKQVEELKKYKEIVEQDKQDKQDKQPNRTKKGLRHFNEFVELSKTL